MTHHFWRRRQALAALLAAPFVARAQSPYPNKPIRVILPFAAGGPGDNVMRVFCADMATRLGQPMVMDNIVGGTGMIGQDTAMRAPADGYTIVAVSSSGGLAYHGLKRTVNYSRDFTPLGQIYSQSGVVLINPQDPNLGQITTLRQLLDYAKANPGKLNYGSQGTGSIGHLVMERINSLAGVKLQHIPYRGVAPAYTALLAGEIQAVSGSLGAMPFIKSGRLRPIGIGSAHRSPLLPEVPTYIESGLAGFVAGAWFGIAAPPNLPAEIASRLSAEIKVSVAKPEIVEKLHGLGTEPLFRPGPEFGVMATNDIEQWGRVLRENNITLQ